MLAEELAFMEHYVRLQHIRYGRTFQVIYMIEPGLGRCKLLKLSLQPLVENAILHGVSQRADAGVLQICARRRDDLLELQITDNGPGFDVQRLDAQKARPDDGHTHMGLRNVRERLALHYGSAASLTIESPHPAAGNGTGTQVTVRLPLEWEPDQEDTSELQVEPFLALAQQWQNERLLAKE